MPSNVQFARVLTVLARVLLVPWSLAVPVVALAQARGGGAGGGSAFTLFLVFAVVIVLAALFVGVSGRVRRRRLPVDRTHVHP